VGVVADNMVLGSMVVDSMVVDSMVEGNTAHSMVVLVLHSDYS
jgi:hypothetical protein